MRLLGDVSELDDARGPFERMREAQQTRDQFLVARVLLELDQALAQAVQELASLDAEVFVGVGGHA